MIASSRLDSPPLRAAGSPGRLLARPSFFLLFAASFMLIQVSQVEARSFRLGMLPNAPAGCNTCHTSGGGTPRNPFGLAVEAHVTPGGTQAFWGPELAALDSDGDGFSNGQELGDLDGNGVSDSSLPVTHPGDASSFLEENQDPVLASIGDRTVAERSALVLVLSAPDADGDAVSFSVSGAPTGASLTGSTFTWTPDFDQAGTYNLTFTAADGEGGTDSESIEITVTDVNRSPILASIGDRIATAGSALVLVLSAPDPDGDTVDFSISDLPAGASLEGSTFTWTPGFDQIGTHEVTFAAEDGSGNMVSETITITVEDVPLIELSISEFEFGEVQVGRQQQVKLKISNRGGAVLVLEEITVGGMHAEQFEVTTPTTLTLEPGQNGDVEVVFTPSTAGLATAVLSILHNAPASPSTASLIGTGVLPPPILRVTDILDRPGDQIAVAVELADATGIGAARFTLQYPADQLSLAEAIISEYARDVFEPTDLIIDTPGSIAVRFLAAEPLPARQGRETLLEVVFEISPQAEDGDVVELTLEDVEFDDASGEPLSPVTQKGRITLISDCMPGDVNGDDRVTLVDALFTLQASLGKRPFSAIQNTCADVNGDDRVTLVDALFILQASLGKRDLSAKPIAAARAEPSRPVVLQGFFEEEGDQARLVLATSGHGAGALDLQLHYDPAQLQWMGFKAAGTPAAVLVEVHAPHPGALRLARLGITGADQVELGRMVFQRRLKDEAARVKVVEFNHFDLNGHQQPTEVSSHFVARPAGLSAAFALYPNMPNPFNPETTIRYDLSGAGAVRLSIHNLSSQLIRTLVDGERKAGHHAAVWDGRNDAGRKVASGTYLYRLQAGTRVEARKLLLLR